VSKLFPTLVDIEGAIECAIHAFIDLLSTGRVGSVGSVDAWRGGRGGSLNKHACSWEVGHVSRQGGAGGRGRDMAGEIKEV
jgi:hypothetical protein